jgi:hypothetical protein
MKAWCEVTDFKEALSEDFNSIKDLFQLLLINLIWKDIASYNQAFQKNINFSLFYIKKSLFLKNLIGTCNILISIILGSRNVMTVKNVLI